MKLKGRHVHEDREVFINLQGKATLLLNGQEHPFEMGDIVVIARPALGPVCPAFGPAQARERSRRARPRERGRREPGEDHHLIADEKAPIVNLWLHGE